MMWNHRLPDEGVVLVTWTTDALQLSLIRESSVWSKTITDVDELRPPGVDYEVPTAFAEDLRGALRRPPRLEANTVLFALDLGDAFSHDVAVALDATESFLSADFSCQLRAHLAFSHKRAGDDMTTPSSKKAK